MNRYLLLAVGLVAVAIVALVWILLRPNTPASPNTAPATSTTVGGSVPVSVTQPTTQSQGAVQAAFKDQITPYNTDNVKLYQTAVSGDYALQLWVGDNTGGEALLKYDASQAKWSVLTYGGGAWSVDGLVAQGVPQTTAEALLANMPH